MSAPLDDLAARRGALMLIRYCLSEGGMLEDGVLSGIKHPADRARALSLARATMRFLGPVDAVLARFMDRQPKGEGLTILRLGATEMLALGEKPYGAVDAAVRLAKSGRKTARVSGLVNAVLRKVGTEGPAIWADMDLARLATPKWLWQALVKVWGEATAHAIATAHLDTPATDLTPRGDDAAAWAVALEGEVTPTGSVRLTRPGQMSGLPGYQDGAWWAQDAAAALPARLAGPGQGRRALDLCAAPGGKTLQLAAAGWNVTALDMSEARMVRVTENLTRIGLSAKTVIADAAHWQSDAPFDLVLLDAPCSATGTIRRHPELPHLRDGKGAGLPTGLQRRLMEAAWTHVAPGGTLIYCVCALTRAEGEERAKDFLHKHEDAVRVPVTAKEIGDSALINPSGDLRTRPDFWRDHGALDGFFAVRLQRRA